ncbi:MAG TPA: hypothetical protein VFS18_01265, partial [Actinomycetota bacterium]|nr:hypothetical protein [Actinomycetota bacterium]
PEVQGYRPPMQFVHEDDVAAALVFAVFAALDGPYNLAPDDRLDHDEIVATLGKRRLPLPEGVAFSVAERLWGLGLAEAPAGMLHYVMHPWVVAPTKLAEAGFRCSHTSREAFGQTVEATRSKLRVGRTRVERRNVAAGAVAGAGLVGLVAAWRGLRRRAA